MNKEEKRAVENFRKLGIKKFKEEKLTNKDLPGYFEFVIILNLIEKLQKENEELKKFLRMGNEVAENSILIPKIKCKIEELNKIEQELQNSISPEEREECSDANISWSLMDINIRREVLQELIEKSEKK